MQPIAELARACMEPLSCERLGFPLGAMKSGGVGHNLTHYLPLQAQLVPQLVGQSSSTRMACCVIFMLWNHWWIESWLRFAMRI